MGIPLHLLAEFHENQFKKTVIYKFYHFKRTTALWGMEAGIIYPVLHMRRSNNSET